MLHHKLSNLKLNIKRGLEEVQQFRPLLFASSEDSISYSSSHNIEYQLQVNSHMFPYFLSMFFAMTP